MAVVAEKHSVLVVSGSIKKGDPKWIRGTPGWLHKMGLSQWCPGTGLGLYEVLEVIFLGYVKGQKGRNDSLLFHT